jgi:hypothetical protein
LQPEHFSSPAPLLLPVQIAPPLHVKSQLPVVQFTVQTAPPVHVVLEPPPPPLTVQFAPPEHETVAPPPPTLIVTLACEATFTLHALPPQFIVQLPFSGQSQGLVLQSMVWLLPTLPLDVDVVSSDDEHARIPTDKPARTESARRMLMRAAYVMSMPLFTGMVSSR